MNKRSLGIIAIVVLAVAGFIYVTKPKASNGTTSTPPTTHIKGGNSAGVTLLEYGDYQCPACGAYEPIVKVTVEKFSSQIAFQFRNFPLEAIHPNARAAARAAEAANLQGKFWEMHDTLYTNQKVWETTTDPLTEFTGYAKQIGITDATRFVSDYKSAAINNVISADLKEANKLGLTGTPSFFIDGKKITNPRDQAAFEKLIIDAIAAKAKK